MGSAEHGGCCGPVCSITQAGRTPNNGFCVTGAGITPETTASTPLSLQLAFASNKAARLGPSASPPPPLQPNPAAQCHSATCRPPLAVCAASPVLASLEAASVQGRKSPAGGRSRLSTHERVERVGTTASWSPENTRARRPFEGRGVGGQGGGSKESLGWAAQQCPLHCPGLDKTTSVRPSISHRGLFAASNMHQAQTYTQSPPASTSLRCTGSMELASESYE